METLIYVLLTVLICEIVGIVQHALSYKIYQISYRDLRTNKLYTGYTKCKNVKQVYEVLNKHSAKTGNAIYITFICEAKYAMSKKQIDTL